MLITQVREFRPQEEVGKESHGGGGFCFENHSDGLMTGATLATDGLRDHTRWRSVPWPLDSRCRLRWLTDVTVSKAVALPPLRISLCAHSELGRRAPWAGERGGVCTYIAWHILLALCQHLLGSVKVPPKVKHRIAM